MRQLEVCHVRTQPYRPERNGKAEHFIHTDQREWAYARAGFEDELRDFSSSSNASMAATLWKLSGVT